MATTKIAFGYNIYISPNISGRWYVKAGNQIELH